MSQLGVVTLKIKKEPRRDLQILQKYIIIIFDSWAAIWAADKKRRPCCGLVGRSHTKETKVG